MGLVDKFKKAFRMSEDARSEADKWSEVFPLLIDAFEHAAVAVDSWSCEIFDNGDPDGTIATHMAPMLPAVTRLRVALQVFEKAMASITAPPAQAEPPQSQVDKRLMN